jgi:hypothetical protein
MNQMIFDQIIVATIFLVEVLSTTNCTLLSHKLNPHVLSQVQAQTLPSQVWPLLSFPLTVNRYQISSRV